MEHLRWLLLPIITYKKRNNKFSKATTVILLSIESSFPDTSNYRLKMQYVLERPTTLFYTQTRWLGAGLQTFNFTVLRDSNVRVFL